MNVGLQVGRIWGIPIRLHVSLLLAFGLLSWSLATGYFPEEYPLLNASDDWILAIITSVLFFASVLAHELGHAYLAQRNQIPVRGITLFIFGGVAGLGQETRSPGAEFRIALAGPLVSLGLAAVFGGLWLIDQPVSWLAAPSIWLARINLSLALFNLIPGFPLDGGRMLRAVVWKLTGNQPRATQLAAVAGQLVAFGFIGWGLFTIFNGRFLDGLWFAFIGWFLQNAAAASLAQFTLQNTLQGMAVAQVMGRTFPRVTNHTVIQHLVDEQMLTSGQHYFFVTEPGNDRLRGMLTLRDVAAVPRADWSRVTAAQVMTPRERLRLTTPQTELLAALQLLDDADVGQLPVVEDNDIKGVLSREQVIHYIRARAELGL